MQMRGCLLEIVLNTNASSIKFLVLFGRQDATFSAAAECRGERGTERHLPVYRWR